MAKSSTKQTGHRALEPRPFTRWLAVVGTCAAASLAYLGARGPQVAVQELRELFGGAERPKLISLQPASRNSLSFIVSIKNPSLSQIVITGYIAKPFFRVATYSNTGASELLVIETNDEPSSCLYPRHVALARPLVIDPGAAGGLKLTPWTESCDFTLSVEGTSGISNEGRWTPNLDQICREWEEFERPEMCKSESFSPSQGSQKP